MNYYELKKCESFTEYSRPFSWYELQANACELACSLYVDLIMQANKSIRVSREYIYDRIVCGHVGTCPSVHLLHNSGEARYSITTPLDKDTMRGDNEGIFIDANGKLILGVFHDEKENEYYEIIQL